MAIRGQMHQLRESCYLESAELFQQVSAAEVNDRDAMVLADQHEAVTIQPGQLSCFGQRHPLVLIEPQSIRRGNFLANNGLRLKSHDVIIESDPD